MIDRVAVWQKGNKTSTVKIFVSVREGEIYASKLVISGVSANDVTWEGLAQGEPVEEIMKWVELVHRPEKVVNSSLHEIKLHFADEADPHSISLSEEETNCIIRILDQHNGMAVTDSDVDRIDWSVIK